MSQPRDDWDADEREALDGLEGELAEIRRKHQDDPSLAILRAADADALPPEMQARVAGHLKDSKWSRAVVEGLRDAGVDDRLDEASVDRLFTRITQEASRAAAPPRRRAGLIVGGLALAATVTIAVLVSRSRPDVALEPDAAPAQDTNAPAQKAAPLTFTKPEVKLSPSALTWRGDPSVNPFLKDLAPAFEAYRASDYVRAVTEFDRVSAVYPDAIEVLFYQGVSRMLAGNDAGAVAPLEAAARLRNATFADDVAWFLAVARQRSGRTDVRNTFAELCSGTGAYASQACAAVKQIDTAPVPRQP